MKATIEAARKAQIAWASNPTTRANALLAAAKLFKAEESRLIDSMVSEVHKPLTEARGECARAIAILEYFGAAALDPDGSSLPTLDTALLLSLRKPHGVAGLITPWNFPVAIPIWKAAPALAAGNAVVIKPSEFATKTAELVGELLAKVLPSGIFTVVPGGPEVGQSLLDNCDVISFTGSVAVGNKVVARAAELGKPVQAEMGGLNPALVLPDADLDLLASHFTIAAFSYSGQKCTATRRIIIVGDEARKKEVVAALVSATEKLTIGDANNEATFIAPLIHAKSYENYVSAVNAAKAAGTILTGGEIRTDGSNLPSPTITDGLPLGHHLMCDEVFAPIAHVVSAATVEEAIAIANGVRYGLTASVHTQDLDAALRISRRLETGMVKVNGPTAGVDFHAPFGGTKDSSYGGREQGKAAMDFYTYTQTVTINPGKGRFN